MKSALATIPGVEATLEYVGAHPVLSAFSAIGVITILAILWAWPYREYMMPYSNLPGPKPTSIFWGNFGEILREETAVPHAGWISEFGNVFRYKTLFGRPRICMGDAAGLAYIAAHTYDYAKPEETIFALEQVLGQGAILTVEGADHRRQRKILNPAFGAPAIKSMHDIFLDKAWELERKISSFFEAEEGKYFSSNPPKPEDRVPGTRKVDVLKYFGEMTLDVIGVADFDYNFNALASQSNELSEAFGEVLLAGESPGMMYILSLLFPALRIFPNNVKTAVNSANKTTFRVASEIVEQKKQLVAAELAGGEKGQAIGTDLLSRVVRANMDAGLRPDQRMSDKEVICQVVSFILAGHETTSTALTWGLLRLAENPDIQKKLRDEVRSFPNDRPSFDELNALPYLDNVVHEILRYDSPVPGGVRVATKHDVIPLSKPVVGRDGKLMDSLKVTPNTDLYIPVDNVNRSPEIWGEDAAQFNPDRYNREGIPTQNTGGVYGNVLTFFGGARNCPGYRMSVAEMKAALFALFRHLEVMIPPSNPVVRRTTQIVMRPLIVGEEKTGFQLPLLFRLLPDA